MTLRRRMMVGLLALLVVFVVGATVTVVVQRGHLQDQVDAQLESTPLPGPDQGGRNDPSPTPSVGREDPVSDLYVAQLAPNQTLTVLISGLRLTDTPDLTALLADPPEQEQLLTVDGVNGDSTFRVRYVPPARNRDSLFVALPLNNVTATVRQLIYTSAIVAALLAAVSALLASWVSRFGLKPISEMTSTADAIAAGDTAIRANSYGEATEAGRLATALNLMLDERDQTDQALRSFVSNASHELRTPLTSIRGYLDLYEQGAFREPEQLDDVIRRMRTESARMNLLVEDLLLLAKLDEEQPLDISDVDVQLLLNDVAASAQAANPGRTVAVGAGVTGAGASGAGASAAGASEVTVRADRLRLYQAVANLVDNAVQHTDARIVIDARRDGKRQLITVTDDGPGLTDDVAAQVFDRFYRGDASRSRLSGGSGLGLSIVKSIVEAHGGTVDLVTEPGQGAQFSIGLPATS